MLTRLAVFVAALGLFLPIAGPAQATPTGLDERVEQILADFPGGTRIASNVIEWDGGAVTLTLGEDGTKSVGTCSTGSYCAYSGASLTGSRLSFTACSATVSTAALPGIVRSVANARSSGTVRPLNSAGTVLATVSAGGQLNNAPSGITQLRCTA